MPKDIVKKIYALEPFIIKGSYQMAAFYDSDNIVFK